jgi:APA family basic amino acid/polyamine antiporter
MPAPPEVVGQLSKTRDPLWQIGKLILDAVHETIRSRLIDATALFRDITIIAAKPFIDYSRIYFVDRGDHKVELKRALGLWEVTLSGVGIILGAGIYALIGEAAGLAGNAVWMAFAISALVALLTGLSYAELSSMFPKASAEYEYTAQAFGRRPAFVIGWLIIFSGAIGAATVSLGFAGYFNALFGASRLTSALVLVVILSGIIFVGIKQSAWVAIVFTLIEALGLVIIIVLGFPSLGTVDYLEMPFGLRGVFQASALIFFAFLGFEEMVKLSEEARDPEKTVPRALILAITACIILYILVSLSAVSVLGWQDLSRSGAPFADIANAAFGRSAFFILSVMALFSTTNTVLLMLLAASRIIYGMADSSSLPKYLGRVHPVTRTPWIAVLASMVLCMMFVLIGDIAFVANVSNFTIFVTFIAINACLILLRYRKPKIQRPFKVPLVVGQLPVLPLLGIILNAFMLIQLSLEVIAIGIGLMALGIFVALATGRS